MYGSFTSESSLSTSDDDRKIYAVDHVRMMLLDQDLVNVLMVNKPDGWDLPLFTYDKGIREGGSMRRCCRDFAQWFSKTDQIHFTAVVELLGTCPSYSEDSDADDEYLKLVVMERSVPDGCHQELDLPEGAEWKDRAYVHRMITSIAREDDRLIPLQVLVNCLQPNGTLLTSISDPRHQLGWYKRASEYLKSVISANDATATGVVVQEHMSLTSTILIANSSKGRYFLKSPSLGVSELSLSEKIASLFPQQSPPIVSVSYPLNCFVTAEFKHAIPDQQSMVQTLGRLQLQSLSHIEELKQAGCPVRDMGSLIKLIERWEEGENISSRTKPADGTFSFVCGEFKQMCNSLANSSIPHTLLHGDFMPVNATYHPRDSGNVQLFDWEFACISHPFCDLFRLYGRRELNEDVLEEYLGLWSAYEDISTARQTLITASKVGCLLKAWSLWERAKVCGHQEHPALGKWMMRTLEDISWVVFEEVYS